MALDGKLPRTWSDVDATSLANYTESMAQCFVELRLCAGDWKASLVATDNYPSWRHNWMKKKNKESNSTSKCNADSHPETTAKKFKTLVESSGDNKMTRFIYRERRQPPRQSTFLQFPQLYRSVVDGDMLHSIIHSNAETGLMDSKGS